MSENSRVFRVLVSQVHHWNQSQEGHVVRVRVVEGRRPGLRPWFLVGWSALSCEILWLKIPFPPRTRNPTVRLFVMSCFAHLGFCVLSLWRIQERLQPGELQLARGRAALSKVGSCGSKGGTRLGPQDPESCHAGAATFLFLYL